MKNISKKDDKTGERKKRNGDPGKNTSGPDEMDELTDYYYEVSQPVDGSAGISGTRIW